MHIPDGGFLDFKTMAGAGVLAASGLGLALWQTRRLPPRRIPLMGLSAAFVFAAQMLNFPVPGGTSGHLIGGVLTAVLLGPSAAVLVLTAVLIVQCFLFSDGGLLALGANVLNMGIVDSVGGYIAYRAVARLIPGERGRIAAVAFAAWFGAVLAALVCSGELVASGNTGPAQIVFPAMVGVHVLIGIGEAIITTFVIVTIWKTRPELLELPSAAGAESAARPRLGTFMAYGLVIAAALALFVSPFASTAPDGLEWVSRKLGFAHRAASHPAPIPNYQVPGIGSLGMATAIAGLLGTIVAFLLAWGLSAALVPRVARANGFSAQVVDPEDFEPGAPSPPATAS